MTVSVFSHAVTRRLLLAGAFLGVCASTCHGDGFKDPVSDISIVKGDTFAQISWKIVGDIRLQTLKLKGFRLYQIPSGTELGFRLPELRLVKDLNTATSYKAGNLVNGELYGFVLKA